MYAESPAGPREGRQLAVVHPPIRSRRVNPSPAIQEAPLGARNPGWGQGGTGLGGLGEATSFTDRRWYRIVSSLAPAPELPFSPETLGTHTPLPSSPGHGIGLPSPRLGIEALFQ